MRMNFTWVAIHAPLQSKIAGVLVKEMYPDTEGAGVLPTA